jgi:hypothetical protein
MHISERLWTHCANLTKLLRDPPFNIRGVSYEVFLGEGGLRKA